LTGPSIYELLRENLDAAGRLTDSGLTLPDEDNVRARGIRWVAGGLDGAFGHHGRSGHEKARAAEIARLCVAVATNRSGADTQGLYAAVADDSVLEIVDPLVEELARRRSEHPALHDLGHWLATTAADRGAVKVGIAILGVTGDREDVAVLRTLGAHDEFSLYVSVALRNCLHDPDSELWALASAVDGWGRIQCVERLRNTEDPAIKAWILREGYRNSIMYEYLAYIAATTGGLLEALRSVDVDRETLTAAGEIFEALITGGPAEDIDDYADGADAMEAYLELMRARAETLGDFHAIATIQRFLQRKDGWDGRTQHGWTASRREAFETTCQQILGRDEWDDRISVGLLSDDRAEFHRAELAARRRGQDTVDHLVVKIREDPLGGPWFPAWEQADTERAEQLADLARTLLPLDEIATGPADETGVGPEWLPHMALVWSLQALRNHPGVGADLLLVGLQSPSIQNRNMALKALQAWPRPVWPRGALKLADRLAASDPNPKTRELAAEILT
jgi:hypothetical protein